MWYQILLCIFSLASGVESNNHKVPEFDGRIVGGHVVTPEEVPYQVSVRRNRKHTCGGVLYSPKFVLTAAHCVHNKKENLSIQVGSALRNGNGAFYIIRSVYEHDQFDIESYDFDIAILKVLGRIIFGLSVSPIPLPSKNYKVIAGTKAVCSGWGRTEENGKRSQTLRAITIKLLELTNCKNYYEDYFISERMLCAGIPEDGKDACYGDSGGPLVADGLLVGIVSWGVGCANPKYPGVYSYMPNLLSFVEKTTNGKK